MRRRWLVSLLLLVILSMVACDRLEPAEVDSGVDFSDPDVGGGAGVESGPETPIPTATATTESSPRLDATAEALATFPPASPTLAATTTPQPAGSPLAGEPTPTPLAPEPTVEPEPSPTPAAASNDAGEIIHVVESGETLYQIGLTYGLSWVAIAEYNGLANADAITVGQELRIPPAPTPTVEAQAGGTVAEAALPPSPAPLGDSAGQPEAVDGGLLPVTISPAVDDTHTVTAGDTLFDIAGRYGVSWEQVAEANGLSAPNQIYAGRVLKIPADVPGPTHTFTHQVRRGDTLTGIARQYGQSLVALAEANGLNLPYVIYPGQAITIPGE
ncbi:MAG: LysM peptidoglycan-binding domain-containing protein [Candidatus Promineofilum sp.]|nr:LysM peptidoglycan-binding domain-containing protein [Promineifilum sp.]